MARKKILPKIPKVKIPKAKLPRIKAPKTGFWDEVDDLVFPKKNKR